MSRMAGLVAALVLTLVSWFAPAARGQEAASMADQLRQYFILKGDYAHLLNMRAVVNFEEYVDRRAIRIKPVDAVTGAGIDLYGIATPEPYLRSGWAYNNVMGPEFGREFTTEARAAASAKSVSANAAAKLRKYMSEHLQAVAGESLVQSTSPFEDDLLALTAEQRAAVAAACYAAWEKLDRQAGR